jgi:hypothetical protein
MKYSATGLILLSPEKVIQLLTMGIEESCIFCYTQQKYCTGNFTSSKPPDNTVEEIRWEIVSHHQFNQSLHDPILIPAWTYEEIRVMIGSSMAAGYVDIPFNFHPHKRGVELRFCVNDLSGQKPFPTGVEALGEVLIKMIENGIVDTDECNARYQKIFKPQ